MVEREFALCRNALLCLLDGDMDAVQDAYDMALVKRSENKRWLY